VQQFDGDCALKSYNSKMLKITVYKLAAFAFTNAALITCAYGQTDTKPTPRDLLEGVSVEPKVVQLLENLPAAEPVSPVPAELVAKPVTETQIEQLINPQTAASLWDRMRGGFAMPNLDTQLAQDKTLWYAKQPDYFNRMTERGSQYLYYIISELERNMPSEIALLPFVESAFNPQAVSSAKAAGMWQFMPATGKHFNLKQNVWRDERRGVVESTRAALDYLQKLHGMFGNWHLALAAYNWGEGSVQRAINKNRAKGLPTEYTDLSMPLETQQYVPKFQAIKNIILSPESYGLALAPLDNAPFFASVIKERDIDVSLAAKFAGMTLAEFKALNPGFKKPVILGANKPEILLPASKLATFQQSLINHKGAMSTWTTVTLSGTEKPASFAKRYGMSEQVLRDVNNIPPRMLIKPGSTLVVPKRNPDAQTANISANLENAQVNLTPELIRRSITARKGDTWARLAKRTGMSVASLKGWNKGIAEPRKGKDIVYYTAAGTGKASKRGGKHSTAKRSVRGKVKHTASKSRTKKRR
jgi:membrane-bound lytic murein transglycosylase D